MGKVYHSGTLPKSMKPYKDNISAMQKLILSRYLSHANKQSDVEQGGKESWLEGEAGQKAVDVAMKLELKEQQIIAQKELGTTQSNPLLVILKEAEQRGIIDVTPKAKEIDRLDSMSSRAVDAECLEEI